MALILTAAYSYAYISAYHKEEGGIYGKLSKVVYNSIEEISEEDKNKITYNFDSLVFKEDEDSKYSIVFMQQYNDTDHRTRFENGENYSIFVHNNGENYECNYIQYDTDWIVAEYSYVFYNSHDETDVIGDDTLSFDFCFYENYSYLKISSSADYTIIQLWNAYFNKYNFQVTIEVVDEVYTPIEFQDNVIEGYVQITQIIEETGDINKTLLPVDNSTFTLTSDFEHGDCYILGWKTKDGETVTGIDLSVSANITLYADAVSLTEMHQVNFYNYDGSEILATKYYQYGDEIDFEITPYEAGLDTTTSKKYTFKGWNNSIREPYKSPSSLPISGMYISTITKSMNLYPVFSYEIVGSLT